MISVLFVCLGNICRSPVAEGIFLAKLTERNLQDRFEVDSAGTSGAHVGESADQRMIRAAKIRGYDLVSRSRKFTKSDLNNFDYILAMDSDNLSNILKLDSKKEFKEKVFLITDYCTKFKVPGVPDPYYGADDGFNFVIDILEDALEELLLRISNE